jgi:cobalt-zinc-cadmium efflux system outer membrane protein
LGVGVVTVLTAARPQSPGPLTAAQAVQLALVHSPDLTARRAALEQAEGRLLTARTPPNNPQLLVEAARRSSPGDTETDHEIALSQEIEIGGQRRRRVGQAGAELESARARLGREEQLLAARVRAAFTEALRARDLVEVERASQTLAASLGEVARKRFAAGAVAQVEVNLAQVQLGRAERELHRAEGAYAVARTLLAQAIGLDPAAPPEPAGELDSAAPAIAPLEALLAGAAERRADLLSLRHELEAARASIELARREAVPNLVVEAFSAREEGTDEIAGGSVAFGIPLFNRNRGAVAVARGVERQLQAQHETAKIAVRQEVAATLARYEAASSAARTLRGQVLGTLGENLDLLQRSFEAGKTSWTEVLVYRREFVDVQREYIDTLTEARLAAIELDLAIGASLPATGEEEVRP